MFLTKEDEREVSILFGHNSGFSHYLISSNPHFLLLAAFKTDADISGRAEIKERELHRWNPDDHNNETFGNLEESASGLEGNGNGSWDQFAVNEKLFGVRTDFDEEIYTTKLDRSAPDFKDREKKAIEKANEIQRVRVLFLFVEVI